MALLERLTDTGHQHIVCTLTQAQAILITGSKHEGKQHGRLFLATYQPGSLMHVLVPGFVPPQGQDFKLHGAPVLAGYAPG